MKIALLGYGKMGKEIEQIAKKRGHEIVARIDLDNHKDLKKLNPEIVDVAIEFSQPESAYDNIKTCLENHIAVVCGTTGWLDRKIEIIKLCRETDGSFFYTSNYSIGVNLFFQLNKKLARLMRPQNGYTASMIEIHHAEKRDAPSGTALTLAEDLVANYKDIETWILGTKGNAKELPIESIREGKIPGTHTVRYSSIADEIAITHTAHNRQGFALGAVMAAEFLQDKKGVFGMDDMLKF